MSSGYFDELATLLKQARPKLAATHRLEYKNCFGAVAGYVDGRIFISCGKFGVALKLPREVLDDLFMESDVNHLKYFPKGHTKKDYAVLPRRILENKRQFRKLVDKSIQFVEHDRERSSEGG